MFNQDIYLLISHETTHIHFAGILLAALRVLHQWETL